MKTSYMLTSNYCNLNHRFEPCKNADIQHTDSIKYFEVIIDNERKRKQHIIGLCGKFFKWDLYGIE